MFDKDKERQKYKVMKDEERQKYLDDAMERGDYFIDKYGEPRVNVPGNFFTDHEKLIIVEDSLYSEEARKHFKLGSYDDGSHDKKENKVLEALLGSVFWIAIGIAVYYFFFR